MSKTRESASPKAQKSATPANGHYPTHDQIALRAYHIYLERGGVPGNELEDWTRAERELVEEEKDDPKSGRKPTKSAAATA